MPPNHQHSTTLNCFSWKRSAQAQGVTGLDAISGTTCIPRMQGDGSTTEPGGIMEVAMLGFGLAWI